MPPTRPLARRDPSPLGLFAGAAGYRATMRVFEKLMPDLLADLVATAGFAAGAAALASAGFGWLERNLPLPTETARATVEAVRTAADEVSDAAATTGE